MRRIHSRIPLVLASLLLPSSLLVARPLPAQEWESLGSREVTFARERDIIPVTAREGRFTAIKLEVTDGNLEMFNVVVIFGDGQRFSPDTRLLFTEGTRSRSIDLPGESRVIRQVEFSYKSRVKRGRAEIHLFGLRSRGEGDHRPDDRGEWKSLGSRTVSFRAEHDVISGLGDGRFRRLRIDVRSGDLDMFDVRITFGDGQVFSPETRLHFGDDSRSRIIDLPGDSRVIRSIAFSYKSVRGGGEGRAEVTVLGQN
ncbi:MAG: hypothetical protein ABI587_15060 [Gemmatimonadales bacterium]